jgi:hypothetical protein
MESWTRLMIRWRWAVVTAWAVIFLFAIAAMSGLSDLLTNRFSLPGSDTERTDTILEEQFGQTSAGSFNIVVRGAPGSAEQLVPEVERAAERASAALPTSQVAVVEPVSPEVVTALIASNLEPTIICSRRCAGGLTHTPRRAASRETASPAPARPTPASLPCRPSRNSSVARKTWAELACDQGAAQSCAS